MIGNRKLWSAVLLAAALGIGYFAAGWDHPRAVGQDPAKGSAPGRYSVVETEATNLIVVDNHTNTLYFYTVEREQPPGSDLHLRGSLDLSQVGNPTLKPKLVGKAGEAPGSGRR
jgi:hypothetical protein